MELVKEIGTAIEVKPEDGVVKVMAKSYLDGALFTCMILGVLGIVQYQSKNKLKFFKYTMVRDEET